VARLVGLVESPKETGRLYLALMGRSLTTASAAARVNRSFGQGRICLLSDAAHLGYLPREKYCVGHRKAKANQ